MALAKINGPMLQANLERHGVNISIDSAAYFDVNNYRVGVNNSSPMYTLDVLGNAHLGNMYVLGNTITTDPGYKLNLGNIANITISGGQPNYIIYTDGAGNLTFGDVDALPEVSAILANIATANLEIAGANAAIVTANNAVVAYVNTLNSAMASNVAGANAAIVTANSAVVGYVNYLNTQMAANVAGANAAIVTANTAVVNYVNTANTAVVNYINQEIGNLSVGGNANIAAYLSTFTGNISAGNIRVDTISPLQTTVTVFNSNTAIGIPSGNSAQRPSNPGIGYIRYNTVSETIEVYTANGWTTIGGELISQTITPDGVANTFALTNAAAAADMLVSINGVVQRPGSAYTVSGSNIVFTEVPLITDIIDVRILVSLVEFGDTVSGNLTIGGNVIVANNISVSGTVTGGKSQSGSVLFTANATVNSTFMGGVLEAAGTLPYTLTLPNPTLYRGQITMWLNASGTLTLTTPAGVIYVTYSGTTSGSGTATVTLANNNTTLFTLMADGYNWSIWGVKTA